MGKVKSKKYGVQRKAVLERNGCIICAFAVLFVFYFIYRNILINIWPSFVGTPLLVLFLVIGLLLAKLFDILEKKRIASQFYTVGENALVYTFGKKTITYAWSDFESAQLGSGFIYTSTPAVFVVNGEEIAFSKYVDNPAAMCLDIINHIKGHVEVDPDLVSTLESLKR